MSFLLKSCIHQRGGEQAGEGDGGAEEENPAAGEHQAQPGEGQGQQGVLYRNITCRFSLGSIVH